ncbi:MAG: tetratricopeptide repeat protein, partial [bacterium]
LHNSLFTLRDQEIKKGMSVRGGRRLTHKTENKQQSEKSSKALGKESLQNWLRSASRRPKELESLLQEFQEFMAKFLETVVQKHKPATFEKSVDQLLKSCFPTPSKQQSIRIQLWKGHSYETFGAWDKALAAYRRVIELCDSQSLSGFKAEAYLWIGHIKLMQNQTRAALNAYQTSLKLSQDCKDEKAIANSYHGLAYYYFEQGNSRNATSYWERSLEIAEKIKDKELIAKVTTNLGVVTNVQGSWEKALAYYGKSLSQVEKIGDARGLAETYHNMAMTYADAERWADAGAHYEKSHKLAKKVGDVHLQALVKLNRVELHLAIGDSEVAEALCQQALQEFSRLEDHLGEADAFKFLGVIRAGWRDWSAAKSFFEKSLRLTRKFQNLLCEAETRFEFGKMLKQKGNKKSAQKQLERALSLFTEIKAKKDIQKVKRQLSTL